MSAINRLAAAAPDWIEVGKRGAAKLSFKANPPTRSGGPGKRSYELVAETRKGELTVSELAPGKDLPKLCVERHINPGSTFCLFMNSEVLPKTNEAARNWWRGLKAFLQHQQYADKHSNWPIDAQMSHGPAADIQRRMEDVADEFGWRPELLASIFRRKGWLGGALPRLAKTANRWSMLDHHVLAVAPENTIRSGRRHANAMSATYLVGNNTHQFCEPFVPIARQWSSLSCWSLPGVKLRRV